MDSAAAVTFVVAGTAAAGCEDDVDVVGVGADAVDVDESYGLDWLDSRRIHEWVKVHVEHGYYFHDHEGE